MNPIHPESTLTARFKRRSRSFFTALGSLSTWFRNRSAKLQVGLHLAISSCGALGLFFGLRSALENRYAANLLANQIAALKFFEWLRPYYFPNHKYTLVAYVVAAAVLGLIFLFAMVVLIRGNLEHIVDRRVFPWIYVADILIVVKMLAWHSPDESLGLTHALLTVAVWGAATLAPFTLAFNWGRTQRILTHAAWPKALIAAIALEFIAVMLPLANGGALFFNDYFDIPSQTFVKESATKPSRLVDNLEYINAKNIWGNQLRYDPRRNPGQDPPCLPGAHIDLPSSPLLSSFVEQHKQKYYLRYPTGELCFIGQMHEDEWRMLRLEFPDSARTIDQAFADSAAIFSRWNRTLAEPEQIDFTTRNLTEVVQQIHQLEAIFHHHFQFLNPVKELSLGRPMNEIVALYGESFVPVAKTMDWFGGVTYTSFMRVMFASYIAYLAALALVAAHIFRDARYVAVVLLAYAGLVQALGYVTVFTGLGYSPVRHFADIFVILLVYQYLASGRALWLGTALVLAISAVFLDRVHGAFLVVALIALLAVRLAAGHSRSRMIESGAVALGVPAFVAAFWFAGRFVAENPYADSFADGVWGFPTDNLQITLLFLGFVAAYSMLAYLLIRRFDQRLYLPLFLLIYVKVLALYWLIFPNYGHLYSILPMAVLAVAALVRFGVAATETPRVERSAVAALLVLAFAISVWGSGRYLTSWTKMAAVERDHKVYEWHFPNTRIRSTMDPAPFEDASNLIRKYARGNGIYIVSQYDIVTSWLADRYSLMPHFDLSSFLNSPEAYRKAVDLLTSNKPDVLFVDSCIRCTPLLIRPGRELIGLDRAYYERTREKIDRLNHLRDVFEAVSNDYELVEQGMLISVYRRKTQ